VPRAFSLRRRSPGDRAADRLFDRLETPSSFRRCVWCRHDHGSGGKTDGDGAGRSGVDRVDLSGGYGDGRELGD